MGGVFSAPKVDNGERQRLMAAAAAEEKRLEEFERQRRGRESTIKTSYEGILTKENGENNTEFKRKKLLGE